MGATAWEIREGDALERLREMPDESVQCCVTSPPYWNLRDYGTEGQIGLEVRWLAERWIKAFGHDSLKERDKPVPYPGGP